METNLELYQEFDDNGNFTVESTHNRFSNMALEQRHEQLNKDVKGISKALNFHYSLTLFNGQPRYPNGMR